MGKCFELVGFLISDSQSLLEQLRLCIQAFRGFKFKGGIRHWLDQVLIKAKLGGPNPYSLISVAAP